MYTHHITCVYMYSFVQCTKSKSKSKQARERERKIIHSVHDPATLFRICLFSSSLNHSQLKTNTMAVLQKCIVFCVPHTTIFFENYANNQQQSTTTTKPQTCINERTNKRMNECQRAHLNCHHFAFAPLVVSA